MTDGGFCVKASREASGLPCRHLGSSEDNRMIPLDFPRHRVHLRPNTAGKEGIRQASQKPSLARCRYPKGPDRLTSVSAVFHRRQAGHARKENGLNTSFPSSGFLTAFMVSGRSAEPNVMAGDWVICDQSTPAPNHCHVAVVTRTGLMGHTVQRQAGSRIAGCIGYADGHVMLKRKLSRGFYESLGPLGPRRLYVPDHEIVDEYPIICALRAQLIGGIGRAG